MKFFVPKVTEAQRQKSSIRPLLSGQREVLAMRFFPIVLFRLWARHEGSVYKQEVGQEEEKDGRTNGDLVFFIIETAGLFLTYTHDRGIAGSEGPIFTGTQDVVNVEYFEDYKPN
jgi:hypothetical protein